MNQKLTINEAIDILGLSRSTIKRRIKSRELKAEKMGNQWFILLDPTTRRNEPKTAHRDPDIGKIEKEAVHHDLERGRAETDVFHGEPDKGHYDTETGQLDPTVLIDHLRSEIDRFSLQLERKDQQIESHAQQNDHLIQVVAMPQKNIGALTEQLDDSRQMVEDMRSRSWWKRIFRR